MTDCRLENEQAYENPWTAGNTYKTNVTIEQFGGEVVFSEEFGGYVFMPNATKKVPASVIITTNNSDDNDFNVSINSNVIINENEGNQILDWDKDGNPITYYYYESYIIGGKSIDATIGENSYQGISLNDICSYFADCYGHYPENEIIINQDVNNKWLPENLYDAKLKLSVNMGTQYNSSLGGYMSDLQTLEVPFNVYILPDQESTDPDVDVSIDTKIILSDKDAYTEYEYDKKTDTEVEYRKYRFENAFLNATVDKKKYERITFNDLPYILENDTGLSSISFYINDNQGPDNEWTPGNTYDATLVISANVFAYDEALGGYVSSNVIFNVDFEVYIFDGKEAGAETDDYTVSIDSTVVISEDKGYITIDYDDKTGKEIEYRYFDEIEIWSGVLDATVGNDKLTKTTFDQICEKFYKTYDIWPQNEIKTVTDQKNNPWTAGNTYEASLILRFASDPYYDETLGGYLETEQVLTVPFNIYILASEEPGSQTLDISIDTPLVLTNEDGFMECDWEKKPPEEYFKYDEYAFARKYFDATINGKKYEKITFDGICNILDVWPDQMTFDFEQSAKNPILPDNTYNGTATMRILGDYKYDESLGGYVEEASIIVIPFNFVAAKETEQESEISFTVDTAFAFNEQWTHWCYGWDCPADEYDYLVLDEHAFWDTYNHVDITVNGTKYKGVLLHNFDSIVYDEYGLWVNGY